VSINEGSGKASGWMSSPVMLGRAVLALIAYSFMIGGYLARNENRIGDIERYGSQGSRDLIKEKEVHDEMQDKVLAQISENQTSMLMQLKYMQKDIDNMKGTATKGDY